MRTPNRKGLADMLDVVDVNVTFAPGTVNERRALDPLTLHLDEGDFATIIGSNGAGKSTLLNVVAGTVRPQTGMVRVGSRIVTRMPDHKRAAFIGRVFQNPSAGTAPHMTIEENLAIAHERGKRRGLGIGVSNKQRELFRDYLDPLQQGLDKRLKDWVGLLSGGQRQALSLLMATLSQPRILLLDEHTAALDPQRAELVLRLTREVVEQQNLTTLMVTHNMQQALDMGNRLIMMHEGRIILDVAGEEKAKMTVPDLLQEFERQKGAISDRTFLA